MPKQWSCRCVVSFDVQGSTKDPSNIDPHNGRALYHFFLSLKVEGSQKYWRPMKKPHLHDPPWSLRAARCKCDCKPFCRLGSKNLYTVHYMCLQTGETCSAKRQWEAPRLTMSSKPCSWPWASRSSAAWTTAAGAIAMRSPASKVAGSLCAASRADPSHVWAWQSWLRLSCSTANTHLMTRLQGSVANSQGSTTRSSSRWKLVALELPIQAVGRQQHPICAWKLLGSSSRLCRSYFPQNYVQSYDNFMIWCDAVMKCIASLLMKDWQHLRQVALL